MRRMWVLCALLVAALCAAGPVTATSGSPDQATAGVAAKKKKAKPRAARQCTNKALRKLKGAKRRRRQAACAKRRRAAAKPKRRAAPARPAAPGAKTGTPAPAASGGEPTRTTKPATATDKRTAANATTPTDYTKLHGLSQKRYAATERTVLKLPSHDATKLHVEVVKPKADGRFPVILEASPYNGRRLLPIPSPQPGERNPLGLIDHFVPRGYAVMSLDLRGTGESGGCIDYMGPNDADDLKHVVEWAARQPWSNGRVGMIGVSYPGSTPIAAAAQRPEGLETVVPIAGWPGAYHAHFQSGVPFFAHWASTPWVYDAPPAWRKPDDVQGNVGDSQCANRHSSATAGQDLVTGRMGPWFTARDWRAKAAAAPIPVLAVHGVNDFSVRTDSLEWFNRRGRAGDKLVLGQWGHSSPPRGDQWRYALTAWFDRHLAGRDVETGAPVEVYLTDGTILEATDRDAADRDEVLLGDRWPLKTTPVAFHPTSDGGMEPTPPAAGSTTFAGTAAGFGQLSQEQHPGRVPPAPGVDVPQDGAIFVSRPLERELVLAGFPSVRLSASVTVPRVHLIATLYDQPPTGVATQRRRLAQCAINPELREGLDQVVTVAPAQRYDLAPSCMVMAHHLRRGHRLVLRVSTSDPDKMPVFAHDPNVTVFTGPGATQVTLPAVATPSLHRDTVRLTR